MKKMTKIRKKMKKMTHLTACNINMVKTNSCGILIITYGSLKLMTMMVEF